MRKQTEIRNRVNTLHTRLRAAEQRVEHLKDELKKQQARCFHPVSRRCDWRPDMCLDCRKIIKLVEVKNAVAVCERSVFTADNAGVPVTECKEDNRATI